MKGLRQTNTASKLHSQQSLILSINRYSRLESLKIIVLVLYQAKSYRAKEQIPYATN